MKKILSLLLLLSISIVFHGGTVTGKIPNQTAKFSLYLTYTWYNDPYYTDPTGSVASIDAELERLRSTYPGSSFTSTPDIGFIPFEYGYYNPIVTAVIYINWF